MKSVVSRMLLVVLALGALVAAGCGNSNKDANGNPVKDDSQSVNLTQGSNLTFAMVTR